MAGNHHKGNDGMKGNDSMFWRLVLRALRLRMQRVSVVFAALTVGAAIVTAMSAVYFDINAKMSQELRTFGANFYIGPGQGSTFEQQTFQPIIDSAPKGLINASSPYIYGMARTELEKVVLMGVWFESLQQLVPYWQVTGNWIGVSFDDRNAMIGAQTGGTFACQCRRYPNIGGRRDPPTLTNKRYC